MKNALKSRLRRDRSPCFGTWIATSSVVVLDALRTVGFEWLVIDTEHAAVNPQTLAALLAVLGDGPPTPLVRLGAVDPYLVKQALDAGAHGVLAPLVNTEDEARRLVAGAKYPPLGVRGAAAAAASRYGTQLGPYLRTANAETMVGVQIETKEALAHVDAIAGVEGVDLLFVGPQDLTLSLGLLDDRTHPTVRSAMREVVDACERHGKVPGTLVLDPDELRAALELGFRFVALAADVRFLLDGARRFLDAARPSPDRGA
jgi:4-hydroxy-2-oxoheptanedioate aldolase